MILALVSACWLAAVASPTPAQVREALDHALDSEYQQELPRAPAGQRGGGDGRRGAGAGAQAEGAGRELPQVGGALAAIARGLLWVVLVAVVVMAALWLGRALANYQANAAVAEPDPVVAEASAVADVVARPLGDAEALARAGQFGEALHALLLRTLAALQERTPGRLPPALTSREILARVQLRADARTALAELVVAVERSHFGGRTPGAAEYAACREQFQRFADVYAAGAGR